MKRKIRSLVTILWIGLFAGTLDIADNLIFNQVRGITPKMVFHYIASGLIGTQAFRSGVSSVALGVALHYTIALIWTGVFYAASRKFAILGRRPVVSGLVYGGAIYLFMNFIVLPLSGVPHPRSAVTIASRVNGVLALLFFIGLPISLLVRRYSNERRPEESTCQKPSRNC
jgi:NADH:ubiquinone oxidoreductase subunit 6 (subunit J)